MSVRLEIAEDGIAVVTIDHPPVNGLSRVVRRGLVEAFERVRCDAGIRAAVLTGSGRMFCAGGDLRELGTPDAAAEPGVSAHVHPAIEACGKPVVAALHGAALGGGLETALACHFRVAVADTRLALPETRLGMIPPSGTQRLPRLVDAQAAIALAVMACECRADAAPAGLIDEVVSLPAQLLGAAAARARRLVADGSSPSLARDRPLRSGMAGLLREAWQGLEADAVTAAQRACFDALEAAVDAPDFDSGLARARAIYAALVDSDAARAARAAFLATRNRETLERRDPSNGAQKIP